MAPLVVGEMLLFLHKTMLVGLQVGILPQVPSVDSRGELLNDLIENQSPLLMTVPYAFADVCRGL